MTDSPKGSRLQPLPFTPLLTVVMPAFNEAGTIATVLDAVLAAPLPGFDLELIVVESNSTDGTRQVVHAYEGHPAVRCVWQDRPSGKGAAVRAGLALARGDIVLIQDADAEYDVADYDALLAPIRTGQCDLVLGSRHTGHWKIRSFEHRLGLAAVLNAGHLFFTALLNLVLGLGLKDPFTMFKVFRRECLSGLTFRCNRFDFDIELLVKLVRIGYLPLEVPVSYRSRSFGEGKKIKPFRDPWTWIVAVFRSRFGPL